MGNEFGGKVDTPTMMPSDQAAGALLSPAVELHRRHVCRTAVTGSSMLGPLHTGPLLHKALDNDGPPQPSRL